jgi:hypothetical protein
MTALDWIETFGESGIARLSDSDRQMLRDAHIITADSHVNHEQLALALNYQNTGYVVCDVAAVAFVEEVEDPGLTFAHTTPHEESFGIGCDHPLSRTH